MFRWLLELFSGSQGTKIHTVVSQGDPRKNFVSFKAVMDVEKPNEQFDLIFSLTTVTLIHGIIFKNIDQDYSRIEFVNGSVAHVPYEINDFLEMLGIDQDDDDDDDEEDDEPIVDDDDPPALTKEQFEVMLN